MTPLPPNRQITVFLLIYFGLFGFVTFLLRNLNLFGKKLGEYLKPNIIFVILVAGAVWSQYAVCLGDDRGQICRLSQAVWIAAVAVSAAILAEKKSSPLKTPLFWPHSIPSSFTEPRSLLDMFFTASLIPCTAPLATFWEDFSTAVVWSLGSPGWWSRALTLERRRLFTLQTSSPPPSPPLSSPEFISSILGKF